MLTKERACAYRNSSPKTSKRSWATGSVRADAQCWRAADDEAGVARSRLRRSCSPSPRTSRRTRPTCSRPTSRKASCALPRPRGRPAMTHGALRYLSGFDLRQLAAEFRALRASVLRSGWRAARRGRERLLPDDAVQRVDRSGARRIDRQLFRRSGALARYLPRHPRPRPAQPAFGDRQFGPLSFVSGAAAGRRAARCGKAHQSRCREDERDDPRSAGIHPDAARAGDSDIAAGGQPGNDLPRAPTTKSVPGIRSARSAWISPATSTVTSTASAWSRCCPTFSTMRCSTAPEPSRSSCRPAASPTGSPSR